MHAEPQSDVDAGAAAESAALEAVNAPCVELIVRVEPRRERPRPAEPRRRPSENCARLL